jgi:hypothetical protein
MGSVSLVSHAIYRFLHYMKLIDNGGDKASDVQSSNPHLNHGVDEFLKG